MKNILFQSKGVYFCPRGKMDSFTIYGFLVISRDQEGRHFVEWHNTAAFLRSNNIKINLASNPEFDEEELLDLQFMSLKSNQTEDSYNFTINLQDIASIKQFSRTFGNCFIIIYLTDGTYLNPLTFISKNAMMTFLENLNLVVPMVLKGNTRLLSNFSSTENVKPILKPSSAHYSLGSFELIDFKIDYESLDICTLPNLTENEWDTYFDSDGRIGSPHPVLERIYHGGVDSSIRKIVWKFLLGVYSWSSTSVERINLDKRNTKEYEIYKNQWTSFTDAQINNWSEFQKIKSKIDTDKNRTNKNLGAFLLEKNIDKLCSILNTYAIYNYDIGYVQGMNNIVARLMVAMDYDEADTFWCLCAYMNRFGEGFKNLESYTNSAFKSLQSILKCLNNDIFEALQQKDLEGLLFSFQWLLLRFEREFIDVEKMWDIFFTQLPHTQFYLFVAAALIINKSDVILDPKTSFETVYKSLAISSDLDASHILRKAKQLYMKFEDSTEDVVKISILGV